MSKLPTAIRPWWPVLKRGHRLLSVLLGAVYRRLGRLFGERGLPSRGLDRSADTAAREPGVVTLHAGGPVEEIVRRVPEGEPGAHWRFRAAETARVPAARYVLEVRDGRLAGDFGATVTPGGVLDYQTSGYFGIRGWREHPLFLHPTLGRVEHVPGTVLSLTTRGAAVNYYHFLYDAIARYGIFEEARPGERPDAIVVPHATGYQRALLELAGIEGPFVQPRAGVTIRADRLLVPSTPNQDLDAPPWVVDWLRRRLPARPSADSPKRLYLTRGDQPNTRRYVQEPELWPWLEQRGFARVDAGSYSVQEQIDLFHNAEIVVAPHGAALTNITFCRPGTRVLEMFAANYVHLGLWTIADAAGLEYRYLVADGNHRAGRPMHGNYTDVSIPVRRVQEMVEKMLA